MAMQATVLPCMHHFTVLSNMPNSSTCIVKKPSYLLKNMLASYRAHALEMLTGTTHRPVRTARAASERQRRLNDSMLVRQRGKTKGRHSRAKDHNRRDVAS